MILRKENERGELNIDWLSARHSFSFGSFFDPNFMGFKALKVINNDIIEAGRGFDTHSHRNMEILTFVLSGEIEHRDNLGNHSIIKPGEIQLISAGSGVSHSEFNPSSENKTELFQIWIEPNQFGKTPRYEQFSYLEGMSKNKLTLLGSMDKEKNKVLIYQNIKVSIAQYEKGTQENKLNLSSSFWIQMVSGEVRVGEFIISNRDGAGFESGELEQINIMQDSEFLLFEFL